MTRSFVDVLCTMPDGATVGDALAACVGARSANTVGERASLRDRVAAAAADDDDNDGADERDTSLAGAAIVARRGWPAEDNSLEWRHTFSYSSTRETTSIQERHIAYVGLLKRLGPNGPSSTTLPHWMWPPCSSYSRRMHCYSMFTTSKGFFFGTILQAKIVYSSLGAGRTLRALAPRGARTRGSWCLRTCELTMDVARATASGAC